MEKLYCELPDERYKEEIDQFKQSFLQNGSAMDGCGTLRRYDADDWILWCRRSANRDAVPANSCYSDTCITIRESDKKIVGVIQCRYELNEYMNQYAGHIGYCVRPDERNKGYATQMLKEALNRCRDHGIRRVLILCLEDNEASRKVILKNGGIYEKTVEEPNKKVRLERYWIEL